MQYPLDAMLAPARGLEALGRAFGNITTSLMEQDLAIKSEAVKSMRLTELSRFNLELSTAYDKILNGLRETDPDPEKVRDLVGPFNSIFDDATVRISGVPDPVLKGILEQKNNELKLSYSQKFDEIAGKKNEEYKFQVFEDATKYYLESFLHAPDEMGEATAAKNYADTVLNARTAGLLSPEHAKKRMDLFEVATRDKEHLRLVGQVREGKFDANLIRDLMDPGKFSMTFEQRKDVLTEIQKIGKERQRQAVYEGLHRQYNGDFDAMLLHLSDPDKIKALGLDTEGVEYLRGYVARAGDAQKKSQETLYAKVEKDFFLTLDKLTPKKIDDALAVGILDIKRAEHLKALLKQTRDPQTDPMTYFRLRQQINAVDVEDQAQVAAMQKRVIASGGLSMADKKDLLGRTESVQDKADAKWRTKAEQYLKEVVMPSQTMITAAKPEEAAQFMLSLKALDDAIKAGEKGGQPLSGKAILDKAMEIAPAFRMSLQEQVDAMNRRIREEAKKKTGAAIDMTRPTKRLRGETIDQYLKRTGMQ